MSGLLGVVLAGGRSSRFGSDKALALAHGRPLLDHAIDTLRPVVQDIVISGREWPSVPSLPDRPARSLGPLAGLNAALHHGQAEGYDAILSLACDTPFVDGAILSALIAIGAPVHIPAHPVIGLWPTDAAAMLDQLLASEGRHSMRAFAERVGARAWEGAADIANFNYAADLDDWLRSAGAGAP
ncbi:MAG: molybdenum cofactor guanylyltransferase [Pseudomonadota bacterium]